VAQTRSNQHVGFGEVLRRYRVAAGLTQEALAERAALSPRGISDLERSVRTRPYPATVRRLADALGLSEADRHVLQAAATPSARCDATTVGRPHGGSLPTPLSSFVGREREVAGVRHLLAASRLVTLLGPGGIGKTRLAIEAATGMVDRFADGVDFVALASVRDPDLVISAVARALGIQDMGGRDMADRLQSHLRTADLLLVLDNFEHVLPAADAVGSLLANCPHLRVLVTSRAPLRLSGECEVPVQPLALPEARDSPSPEELGRYEAVRLFIERGSRVRPQLMLTGRQATAVAGICARLDGLPLAIELAAARLRVLSPEVLLERLEHALPLLVGGPRDMPARQQTLAATIGWSYDLLDPAEQRLFRRMSVFVGGFTLDAAEAVCGDADLGLAVLDGLESLLAKSLLGRHDEDRATPRFRMLETVREYALEQARAAGELAEFRRRHAAYFLRVAEMAASKFSSVSAPEWLQRLETDHNNLRASLSWALEEHDADTALRLSSAVWHFWYARGYLTEGARWLEAALRMADAVSSEQPQARGVPDAPRHVTARARALTGAGVLAHYQGHYARAATLCGRSLALCRKAGDQPGIASALRGLALVARSGGDFATARTMYEEARRIHEALGDQWGLSYTLRYLAIVLWMEADYAAARPVIDASLSLAREIGDGQGVGLSLTVTSYVACSLGEHEVAETAARDAFAHHESYGDRRGAAQALWTLGMAVAGQARYQEANAHHKRALSTFAEIGDRYFMGVCFIGLAQVAVAAGRPRDAVCLLAADSATMAAIGAPRWRWLSITPYIQRTLDQARTMLDETTFEQAWTTGEALSVEEAATLAMAVPDPARHVRSAATHSDRTCPLTPRELAVARRVARGLTNKQIAAELVIAEGTADRHLSNILGKLAFSSRAQVAAWVVEHAADTGARPAEPGR
jgi:predicted ATPase/DNA-binding CsgD family transcriptional regulator/transcriptional regulator with XRE-family HTH domain